ncbi:hypothetical protein BHE74_00054621 [Ensete ventricosum]|nr:hypothetical protein GW17_00052901 [Ensete ventricosum]RWW39997.1 hypothetical protein BHE74_00054621 [Ensete ventricosum]
MRSCLLQIDKADDPERLKSEAEQIGAICISAISGDGLEQFCSAVQAKLKEFMENGTLIRAHVPLPLARLLNPMRQLVAAAQ